MNREEIIDEARIRRYVDRVDEPTVAQVLGHFLLDPDEYRERVAELLEESNNRARDQPRVPSDQWGASQASHGEAEPQEEENRHTAPGLLRLLRVNGDFDTPSPEIGGGEGGRARVGLRHPEKSHPQLTERGWGQ